MSYPFHTINIIGSGNVASHLARVFHQSGFEILGIHSKTFAHASALAKSVNSLAVESIRSLPSAEITIIAVSDDQVNDVIEKLPHRDQLLLHTSGTLGLEVFGKQRQRVGIFYPLQTFSKTVELDFSKVPILYDGDSPVTQEEVKQLIYHLGNKAFSLSGEQKVWMHLNAVVVNNFVNHLLELARRSSEEHQIPFEIYHALIDETINKALSENYQNAQTGPAKRGDHKVIEKHLDLLKNTELESIYKLLSKSIGDLDFLKNEKKL